MYTILGIGELLWDMLPERPQLGGAPANYTVMAGRLGDRAAILSRIGKDDLGRDALKLLKRFPVDCGHLQLDPEQATGHVTVTLQDAQASYTIHQPVAWDFLELTDAWLDLVVEADAVCFGSLAQRSEQSRKTIQALVQATSPACKRIFDVNLRPPFYNEETVRESVKLATVVKMNDAEVPQVLRLLRLASPESATSQSNPSQTTGELLMDANRLLGTFPNLNLVAITRGGEGSLLVGRSEWHQHPGISTRVADTIGAGDAFTAAMTHYLLRGAPLRTLNEAGNRWGSFVASQSGAMPKIDAETVQRIASEIEGG